MKNLTTEELEWTGGGGVDRNTAVKAGQVAGFALSKLVPKPLQSGAAVGRGEECVESCPPLC